MLSEKEAKAAVAKEDPDAKIVDIFWYNSLYLVRIQHPSPAEADWDPFYSVNPKTGEVAEFSVITDGDPMAIMQAYQKSKQKP